MSHKYQGQLESLQKDLNSFDESSARYSQKQHYFIKWLEIGKILSKIKQLESTTPELRQLNYTLSMGYKQVIPELVKYRNQLKANPIPKVLDVFKKTIFHAFDTAEEYLSTIPIQSYKIYEEILYFLTLFQDALNASLIAAAKKTVHQKLAIIKNAFETEAGRENLESEQKSLSQNLENNLEGKKTQPIVAAEDVSRNLADESGADLTLDQLAFPEEDLEFLPTNAEVEQTPSEIYPEAVSLPQHDARMAVAGTVADGPTLVYPINTWFPANNWKSFLTYRYCDQCGKVIHPQTRVCTGCQYQF